MPPRSNFGPSATLGAAGVLLVTTALVLAPGSGQCARGEHPTPDEPTSTGEGYAGDLRALREIVEREWSYLEMRSGEGLELEEVELEALSALAGDPAPDAHAFAAVLRRYVAALSDGHAGVEVPGVSMLGERRLPFALADAVEGVILHGVHEPSVGEDLARGDIVLAIDGEPIEERIARKEGETFASTPGARRMQALFWMQFDAPRESVSVSVRGEDGTERTAEVACPPADTTFGVPLLPLWRRELRLIDGEIGYFRPGSFSWPKDSGWREAEPEDRDGILAESYAELRDAIAELRGAKVLVLDLRRNPGGTDLLGQELAGMLLPRGTTYYRLQARYDGDWSSPTRQVVRWDRDAPRYEGPLLCLIDEGTFSVADNFAACLADEHPDVTFVGRPTAGGTGAPRPFTLPASGARVTLCTMRVHSPRGGLIEGRGTQPDVPVRFTRADYLQARDPDLDRALELARERLTR